MQNRTPDKQDEPSLKLRTARTLKWNGIDRISSQVMYAVVGVVLANILSKEDFGLVGVILVFQAFAILFVDSGFGAALLQKKEATNDDYSTVFWFNTGVSVLIYIILWFCAPLIAQIFHDERLVALSRVMFTSFILNALSIVQTNRLMKRMDVKMISLSNLCGLIVSGGVGIILALSGYGAWALVWQTVILAFIKGAWLWITGGWMPTLSFKRDSLRNIWKVGISVFSTSFLNTCCLYAYSFIIGAYYNLRALGVYTQADKWSKMGSASLSQILTATFVPMLSRFQDDRDKFLTLTGKINRLCAFMVFPFMGGLIVMAEPIFHLLFGNKWDEAIPLFQILTARGILVILISLYNNYILALGYAKKLVSTEIIKDILIIAAILATIKSGSVEILVWGQFLATLVTFIIILFITHRAIGYKISKTLSDNAPYFILTAAIMAGISLIPKLVNSPAIILLAEAVAGAGIYYIVLKLAGSAILKEAQEYALGRFRKNR
jgi:O-antigen/teichoic acid export membrane protein